MVCEIPLALRSSLFYPSPLLRLLHKLVRMSLHDSAPETGDLTINLGWSRERKATQISVSFSSASLSSDFFFSLISCYKEKQSAPAQGNMED